MALFGVTLGAVDEQVRQERGIKERQNAIDLGVGQEAPRPGGQQLEKILKVARLAPESRGQEQALLLRFLARDAVNNFIVRRNIDGVFAPDLTLALGRTKHVTFAIGEVVEENPGQAQRKEGTGHGQGKARRVLHEKTRVEGVDSGNPNKAAPLNFKAGAINNDVNRTHVSHFPQEKLEKVQVLGNGREEETPIHSVAVQRVRAVAKRQASELPKGHAEAAINESFQVEIEDAWIKFSTCQV